MPTSSCNNCLCRFLAYGRRPDVKTYVYKASSDPFSNYKAFKSRKSISTRKVGFDSWTMTSPSSSKKRKIITRRKSWPPDAPHKLNVRKKYQNLKLKDALEPFWTDTYEWATMQKGPEDVRPAPLAKLAEFTDLEKYKVPIKAFKPTVQNFSYEAGDNSQSMKSKNRDVVKFYFIKKEALKAYCQKNYLTNLKRMCAADNRTCVVRALNQTNFTSEENCTKVSSSKEVKSKLPKSAPVLATNHNAALDFDNDELLNQIPYTHFTHSGFPDRAYVSHAENASFGRSSVRQLHSLNTDLSSDVTVERPVMYLDDDVTHTKNKLISKDIVWNKENIKIDHFSDSKTTHIVEKCKPFTHSDTVLKNQKLYKSFKPQSKNVKLTTVDWPDHFDKPEIKLNKSVKNKIKGSPHSFENKAPHDMDTDSKSSGNVPKTAKDPSSQSSSSNTSTSGQVSAPTSSQTSSNQSNTNKPYLRQLFEQDIQSNFESLKKDKDKEDKRPKPEKSSETGNGKSTSKSSTIPANVVGFDFLTTLQKRTDIGESSDETFPASVIGQAFLDNLAEQKEKYHGSSTESKSIPSSVVGLSFLKSLVENATSSKSDDPPLPASVIGQSFLKNLLESQSNVEPGDAKLETPQPLQRFENPSSEQAIPSSVIGQAFLKTLVDAQQHIEKRETPKPIPSEVLGQTFLKSLIDGSKDSDKTMPSKEMVSLESQGLPSSVPAAVIGQSFLKNLLEQSTITQNPDTHYAHPVSVIDETVSKAPDLKSIPKEPLPASVIGQSFLATLLKETEQENISSEKNVIPAPVIGQSFLKNLLEGESSIKPADGSTKEIPAPVVGQAFLKSLIESHSSHQPEAGEKSTDTSKIVPATVVGQSFLKSLTQEQPVQETQKDLPIPASVIGQAFLKTLGANQTQTVAQSQSIPAPVIGQTFLKSLLEQPSSNESQEKTIPAPVLGQSFLKSLIEKEGEISKRDLASAIDKPEKGETQSTKPIPSSVVGQTFLKSLVTEESAIGGKTEAIPSKVIGQAFLKTLLEAEPASKEVADKPIPANVLGQVFLKCLAGEGSESSDVGTSDQTISSKDEKKETVIPSQVLSQAFLKTLTIGAETASKPELQSNPQEASIPASVIGLAFLKTLTSQSEDVPISQPQSAKKSVPAGVVGQAFLKTLVNLSDDSTSTDSSPQISKRDESVGNGFHAESFDSDSGIDVQSPIIPPPPEFGSSDPMSCSAPGTSANVDATPGIIGELLSYTKMMHSVIESMKETEDSHEASSENQKTKKD